MEALPTARAWKPGCWTWADGWGRDRDKMSLGGRVVPTRWCSEPGRLSQVHRGAPSCQSGALGIRMTKGKNGLITHWQIRAHVHSGVDEGVDVKRHNADG